MKRTNTSNRVTLLRATHNIRYSEPCFSSIKELMDDTQREIASQLVRTKMIYLQTSNSVCLHQYFGHEKPKDNKELFETNLEKYRKILKSKCRVFFPFHDIDELEAFETVFLYLSQDIEEYLNYSDQCTPERIISEFPLCETCERKASNYD